MHHIPAHNARDSRLRFVFSDAVMSLNLAADATFEDVAWSLRDLKAARHGHPLAIDIVLADRQQVR